MDNKKMNFAKWLYDSMDRAKNGSLYRGQIEQEGRFICVGMYGAMFSTEKMPINTALEYPSAALSMLDSFLSMELCKVSMPSKTAIRKEKAASFHGERSANVTAKIADSSYNLSYLLLALDAVKAGEVFKIKGEPRSMLMVKNKETSVFILPIVKSMDYSYLEIDLKCKYLEE